jgi:hypothetical protein
VELSVVAVESEACEFAEVRQIAAVLFVFKHICDTAQVVGRI